MRDGNYKYRREALDAMPAGCYELQFPFELLPSDGVWSWTTKEWLRADSPKWKLPHEPAELVCAARRAQVTQFERSIEKKRSYTIK